ncbi:DUF3068 domain-containing protein [Nocardia vinacea]|uniref:DUF3068 domain-containing protein n=1 Tax=Nocardia vinacea TaxID=96468 RepID=A0ABZ1YY57_9NOCA|nr:DUF3068 domain-containing protein [Nocardia vinacea]
MTGPATAPPTPVADPVFRSRRERWPGWLALGLGTLLSATAVAIPMVVADMMIKIPAPMRLVTVAVGTGSVLDVEKLIVSGDVVVEHGVPLKVTSLAADTAPTNSAVITLRVTSEVDRTDRTGNGALLNAFVDQVSVDRFTGEPKISIPALSAFEPGQRPLATQRAGFQYKFPFDMSRRSHPYFDVISQQDTTLDYIDDHTVRDGIRLLHFRNVIDPVSLATFLPTSGRIDLAVAAGAAPTPMTLFYSADRDLWIDPVTGAVIRLDEHQRRYLATSVDDPDAITAFDGEVHFDDPTVSQMLATAKQARAQLTMLYRDAPVALGISAMAALGFGIRRWRAVRHEE